MIIEVQKYWGDREIFHVPELCSKIIHGMQTDGSVTLMTKEHRSAVANGGFALLDSLCEFWKWDKSKISLITANQTETHSEYQITHSKFRHPQVFDRVDADYVPWTKEKCYGLFIGRANSPRIHAIHAHDKFKFKHLGLASFHSDLFEYMDKIQLVDYFMESNQTYKEMIKIKPFSDIDVVRPPPITPGQYDRIDWASVYSKIGIEIVCETSTAPGVFALSEKLDRCVRYRRPFLTIAPAGFNKFINNFSDLYPGIDATIKTFEDYFGKGYDDLEGLARVNAVFDILNDLIESGKIYSILEECKADIEHNYTVYGEVNKFHHLFKTDKDEQLWNYWELIRMQGKNVR